MTFLISHLSFLTFRSIKEQVNSILIEVPAYYFCHTFFAKLAIYAAKDLNRKSVGKTLLNVEKSIN